MKHRATLTQPGITKAILAECEFEAPAGTSEQNLRLISAHLMLENFDINGSWEGSDDTNSDQP